MILGATTFTCCQNNHTQKSLKAILLADREAPLGWMFLRIYQDSSFEFESKGLRNGNIYKGFAKITVDTVFFTYTDSVPRAGNIAIYDSNRITYINGDYPESMPIKFSELNK